jgi:hypothetical protein
MKSKVVPACRSLLVVPVIIFVAAAAFGQSQQASPASPGPGRTANQRQSTGAGVLAAAAPVIAQVEVTRDGHKTIVQVKGNSPLVYHTMNLSNPDRVVLDFSGALLAIPRSSIPATFPPIRRVRAGQFTPDAARVVIDLERAVPYQVRTQENGVTVEFDASASVSSPAAAVAPVDHVQHPASPRAAKANVPAISAVGGAKSMPPSGPLAPRAAAPVAPVSPEDGAAPLEDSFEGGMLTFRAQNEALQLILKQIGDHAGVKVYLAEGLGQEQISVEFRRYRLDEALRQMLKAYDAVFLYGAEQNGQGPVLQAVWIYSAGRAQTPLPLPEITSTTPKQAVPVQARSNPGPPAEAATPPKRSDPLAQVLKALQDPNDDVREHALSQALAAKTQIPQETLVNLAVSDVSPKVRLLALRALPVDPDLRWVAERAAGDWDQSVSQEARAVLHALDVRERAESLASHAQEQPKQ